MLYIRRNSITNSLCALLAILLRPLGEKLLIALNCLLLYCC
jgi:hypothetical protein